jgi:hypothetical protein
VKSIAFLINDPLELDIINSLCKHNMKIVLNSV